MIKPVKTTDKIISAGRSLWGYFSSTHSEVKDQPKEQPKEEKKQASIVIGRSMTEKGTGWSFAK